jgi:hypothetical protein
MLNVPITPPRVPLIDERTGLIDRAWYLFFLSLNNVATTIEGNPNVGPNADTLVASYDAALRALAQDVSTLPPAVQTPVGDDPAIDNGLLSTVTEMQKQIDALNSLPPPSQGTVTSVTATAPVVSSGGTTPDISMPAASTSVNGYLTSTDWNTFNGKAPATSGTSILYGNGSGGFNNVTIGTGVSFAAGTLSATGSGGTVTSVSVVSANGFAGTVATATTTPAITLTTSITGLLKGNATAISAAVVNTDYFAPSAPVTKVANFTVADTDVWLINNKSGSSCTATLPAAASWSGRVLRFQNYQAQTLISASSNVVPLAGGAAGTSILLASSGDSATLVSDGSNWLMTQYVPNNILLLE